MGQDASMIMGYGVIISKPDNPLEDFSSIDKDKDVRIDWRNPENNGPLFLGFNGDIDGEHEVVLFVTSTLVKSDWSEVTEFNPDLMHVPDWADDLLRAFCDRHGISFESPRWLITVTYS